MNPFHHDKSMPQNVQGWERAVSIAGGLMMLGKGLRRGGVTGVLRMAMGGMALARGLSGRCEAKRLISDASARAGVAGHANSHQAARPETEPKDLPALQANALAATETASVTGNDGLRTPPAAV